MTDDDFKPGPTGPCCWPDCTDRALWQNVVENWHLCFTHTALATEFVDRTALGLKRGEPIPHEAQRQRLATRARTQKRREQQGDNPGWVYYAKIGDNIKIGYAADVKKRMAQYPPETRVLAVEPGSKKLERERHKEFAHSLIHGREWFRESYPITKHIETLRAKHGSDLEDLNHSFRKHDVDSPRKRSAHNRKGWAL